MEADGHYLVEDDVAGIVGSVSKVEAGGWRAYDVTNDELPGATVYQTRDEAAEAIVEATP
jgi:hypothetical protein